MNRYNRHIILKEIGPEGQQKLSEARVLVVGAGGLGCPALQYLVAAGIGTVGIIDHDIVEESNLLRQILFGTTSLGKNKALAAKDRLEDLNPTVRINAYPYRLESNNALEMMAPYDIVVDGTDNFSTRYLINDAAIILNKPVVYAAIYKFEGQVSVFNYQNGPSYRCMFPLPPQDGSVANCSEVGVLGVLPGIIGSMQANEVLKVVLGLGDVLTGKLLCYDSQSGMITFLKINKSEKEFDKVLALKDKFESSHYEPQVNCTVQEISIENALRLDKVQFLDVRELHETPRFEFPQGLQIPLGSLAERLSEIDLKRNTVVFCKSGVRSSAAVALLTKHQAANCYSLKGGVSELKTRANLLSNEER